MRPQEFLAAVRDRAAARLPAEMRDFQARTFYATLQLHFGNPRAHYEVWLVRKTGRIEVGLHFEGEREDNERLAAFLAERVHQIREQAGPEVELEQWTASWTRLHATLPLGPLTASLCDEVAAQLGDLIAATRPLLEHDLTRATSRRPAGGRFAARRGRTRALATR